MTLNLTVPATTQGRAEWAASITDIWTQAVDAFISAGRELIDAKASLPYGEFQEMVKDDLPFGIRTAARLMVIAEDRRIWGRDAEKTPGSILPASWRTLYELTRLDDATLDRAFEDGKITPDMGRADVKRLGAVAAAGDGGARGVYEAATCAIEDLNAMAAAQKAHYGVILADPPWTFETYSAKGKGRSAERHYACMTDLEIAALPIKELAADDCVLFLWTTAPKLEDALWVIQQWGFDFKTMGFTWIKRNRAGKDTHEDGTFWSGMGFWTRSNAEFCLLATRGAPKRRPGATDVHELIVAPVREHSRKPDEARKRIGRLVAGPYLELFARSRAEEWDAWGAEVGKFDDAADDAGDDAPASKKPAKARRKAPAKSSANRSSPCP